MSENPSALRPPLAEKPAAKPNALIPALLGVMLPVAGIALAWMIAGKIPFAVPTREWGTWFVIGPVLAVAACAGLIFSTKAFVRGGQRTLAVAGFLMNAILLLVTWAGLFG